MGQLIYLDMNRAIQHVKTVKANHIESVMTDLLTEKITSHQTEASAWLSSLPKYTCPYCKEETVFQTGHFECHFPDGAA